MSEQELLQSIRQIVEEAVDKTFDRKFDEKIAPIAKDIEAIKVAVLEIDAEINNMKSEIKEIKEVTAQHSYEIMHLKTKIA